MSDERTEMRDKITYLGAQIAALHTELARLRGENDDLRRALLVFRQTGVALMRGGQGDSDELPFCDEGVEDDRT